VGIFSPSPASHWAWEEQATRTEGDFFSMCYHGHSSALTCLSSSLNILYSHIFSAWMVYRTWLGGRASHSRTRQAHLLFLPLPAFRRVSPAGHMALLSVAAWRDGPGHAGSLPA